MKKLDSAKVTITLIPYGYQIDVDGGDTFTSSSGCRDWGGDIDVEAGVLAIGAFVHDLDKHVKGMMDLCKHCQHRRFAHAGRRCRVFECKPHKFETAKPILTGVPRGR